MPGPRRDALARRPHARSLGPILLHSRRAARARLVRRISADLPAPEGYEVIFAADKATIRRRDADIETLLEVTVSPEQPVEVRRITLTNHDTRPRELEITSYCRGRPGSAPGRPGPPGIWQAVSRDGMGSRLGRLALLAAAAIRPRTAGLCHARRGRGHHGGGEHARGRPASTRPIVLASSAAVARPANPAALDHGVVLSGTTGPVLDPVFSPAPSGPAQAGRIGRDRAGHGSRRLAFRGTGAGRSVSRGQRRVSRVRAGVGTQPGRAPAQRSIRRGSPTCFSAWLRT